MKCYVQTDNNMQICFYFDFETSVLKDFYCVFFVYDVFCLDVFLKSTSPSSLNKPLDSLLSLVDNKDNIWILTSLQISTPKLPMVTLKQLSVFFFFQGSLLLYNEDFLQCFIISKSFSGILMCCWETGLHYVIFLQI